MDIIGYIFEENNPAGIKAVFEAHKSYVKDTVRLPVIPASNNLKKKDTRFCK